MSFILALIYEFSYIFCGNLHYFVSHGPDALHRCRHEARCESVDQLDRHGGCFTAANAQAGDAAFAAFLAQGMNQRGDDA